jgi:hypothetical protein
MSTLEDAMTTVADDEAAAGEAAPHAPVDLGVPAYVHPLVDPGLWDRLAEAAAHVRFAVVNVHDGPGAGLDPTYADVVHRLVDARVRVIGYVDTAYADRPVADCGADARAWVTRYGLRGVFLDQVSQGLDELGHYSDVVLAVRAAGAPFVVLNPGTDCHPAYADLANVVVLFEGTWDRYQRWAPPDWSLRLPASRFCHLVHDVPAGALADAPAAASARHAGTAFFSDGRGDNPWDRLPPGLVAAVAAAHPGASPPPALAAPAWRPRRFAAPGVAAPPAPSGLRARLPHLTRRRPPRPAPHAPHGPSDQGDPR